MLLSGQLFYCCLHSFSLLLSGQLQAQQNKTPLSRKTHEQSANRSQEKSNSANRVSIPSTKTTGKTSALKEQMVDTQTSQPEQSTGVTLSPVSRRSSIHNHKTSALQQGTVRTKASLTQTAEASSRCKKSSAVPETSTPLQTFMRKRRTQPSVSQSRPLANTNKPSSLTKSLSIRNDEPVHHIKWDGKF